jgi:DNA transformation protein and related proteins
MPVSQEYLNYVADQLTGLGQVKSKRMFGGAGLYLDGIFFGLVADDVLYFKVDDTNKADYVAAGSGPFKPFGNDSYEMGYYEVPGDVLEDPELMKEWAMKALSVAKMKKAPQRKKPVHGKKTMRGK